MALPQQQKILQRRSAVSGSLPTISTLFVGEIGLNTYDGKAYIHKAGSVESIEQLVVTNSDTVGNINIIGTGSFSELVVRQDLDVTGSIYVNGDIVGLGDIDFAGSVTASAFVGDGSKLTNIVISAANNYDFNTDPSAGYVGYLENSGSTIYNITPTTASIEFRKDGSKFAEITQALGFSGSLYGIGDVLAFSGSVASRLQAVESLIDAGTF
jgi:hypothetical protein